MTRRCLIDKAELAAIEADLDALEALLRKPRAGRRSGVPAAGGGLIAAGRGNHEGLRPRPAAFVRGIAAGLTPMAAAREAGYRSPNRMTIWRLMRDAKVIAEIARLAADRDAAERVP